MGTLIDTFGQYEVRHTHGVRPVFDFEFCPVTLVGGVVSGPAVAAGTVLLIFDLGAGLMEPERLIYMFEFRNPESVMMWGVWILTIFIPLAFLYGIQEMIATYPQVIDWSRKKGLFIAPFLESLHSRSLKRLVALAGSVFAVGTALYTGVLMSAMGPAVPFWSTGSRAIV